MPEIILAQNQKIKFNSNFALFKFHSCSKIYLNFKANKPFKIKVLFEGKPLANAAVEGAPDGFLEDMSAFYGMTDDKGEIEVMALKPGPWILKARNKLAFSDPKKCDEETIIASFAFEVK